MIRFPRTKGSLVTAAVCAAVLGAVSLAGCGDKPAPSGTSGTPGTGTTPYGTDPAGKRPVGPDSGTAPMPIDPHHAGPDATGTGKPKSDGTTQPGTRPGRATAPLDRSLPAAPPLTSDAAHGLLDAAIAGIAKEQEAAFAAIDYLGRLGDADAVRKAAEPLLAKGEDTGGYDDAGFAAAALTAMLRAGDASASGRLLALAEAYAAGGEVGDTVLAAAPLLPADQAARMKTLLATWAAQEDNFSLGETLEALAALRPTDADTLRICAGIARDPEQHPGVRASALGVLLAANEAEAQALGDAIATEAFESGTGSDVVDGLAIRGLVEAIPFIRKIVEKAIAEEAASPEIRSAAFALVDIRGVGTGKPEDLAWLKSLLGKEDGISDQDVRAALWALGDDAETGAAAAYLAEIVGGVRHSQDPSSGLDILEALAVRGGALKAPFDRIVSASAVVQPSAAAPHADISAQAARMRLAAAYAFLSQK